MSITPNTHKSKNLFFCIIYIFCEIGIFFHLFNQVIFNNDVLIKLFLYFQVISIFPAIFFFNTTNIIEKNKDGIIASDEFSFNIIILIKIILISLIYKHIPVVKYELLLYLIIWKISYSIRTIKLHNYILPPAFNKEIEKYFICAIVIYLFVMLLLFSNTSILFLFPILIECLITLPSRLFKKEADIVPLEFPIKKYDIIKSKYKKSNLSSSSFFVFLIILLWNFNIDPKSLIAIAVLLFSITFSFDNRERKYYQIPFFKYYSGFVYKLLVYLVIFILLKFEYVWNKNIDKSNLITILIPLLVFNLGAFFILLQFNYQKYSSSFLIKKLINPIVVALTLLFPAIILIFICFISDCFLIQHIKFSYFSIIYTILSSALLIVYFSFISESWILLNGLLSSTKWTDFEGHKDSIFQLSESKIESIQSIINSDIKNSSTNIIRTDLLAISDWTKLNINYIKYISSSKRDIIDNRFIEFYNSIISSIFIKKDPTINDLFFRYFNLRCLSEVNKDNFYDYTIIYDIIFNFLKAQIEIDEKNAKLNLARILVRGPYILQELEESDFCFQLSFEDHITDNIVSLYDFAIKTKKNVFITKYPSLSDLFSNTESKKDNLKSIINESYIEIYNKIRGILRELIIHSSLENNYLDICVKELNGFSDYFYTLDINNINVHHLWDYHLYTCEQLIKKAKEIPFEKKTNIFSPLFDIMRKTNSYVFDNTLFLLTKLMDEYFSHLESTNNEKYIYSYWMEMDNLLSYYKNDCYRQSMISSFMNTLVDKHSLLNKYPDIMEDVHSNFIRIEDFDYSKLDIRYKDK